MIERAYGKIELLCDDCGDGNGVYDNDDFIEMMRDSKNAGWKTTKEGDEWVHTCSDCQR